MKKISTLFFLLSFLCLPITGKAENPPTQKFYCTSEQIEFTDSMILVHLYGQVFETDSLHVDQGGIYFTEDMLRCTYCRRPLNPKNTCECPQNAPQIFAAVKKHNYFAFSPLRAWYCQNCGNTNECETCDNCGAPKSSEND